MGMVGGGGVVEMECCRDCVGGWVGGAAWFTTAENHPPGCNTAQPRPVSVCPRPSRGQHHEGVIVIGSMMMLMMIVMKMIRKDLMWWHMILVLILRPHHTPPPSTPNIMKHNTRQLSAETLDYCARYFQSFHVNSVKNQKQVEKIHFCPFWTCVYPSHPFRYWWWGSAIVTSGKHFRTRKLFRIFNCSSHQQKPTFDYFYFFTVYKLACN